MIRLSGMDYMNIFGYTGRLGFKNSNLGKTNTHYSNYGIGLSKRNTNSTYSTALTNSQKTLSTVGNEASALVKSANKLAGDVSYKNVEAFVENYNDTVAALSKTVNSTVRSSGNSIVVVPKENRSQKDSSFKPHFNRRIHYFGFCVTFFLSESGNKRKRHLGILVKGEDVFSFKEHANRWLCGFELSNITYAVDYVSGKSGYALCYNKINFPGLAVANHTKKIITMAK